jgi:hypothetical protein
MFKAPEKEIIKSSGFKAPSSDLPEPGIFDKISAIAKQYKETQQGSPQDLLSSLNDLINKGSGKVADVVHQDITGNPENNVDPITAGLVDFPIRHAADIASFAVPVGGANPETLAKSAQNSGMKSLGMTKRFLSNPKNLERGRETAQILLDKKVITPLASAETMAERAGDLSSDTGKQIGDYLKSVGNRGKFFNTESAISELEKLRPQTEGGKVLSLGHNADINAKINKAVETIREYGPEVSFEEANKIKGQFQGLANFRSNKDATLLDKVIAGKFRESIDTSLEAVSNTAKNKGNYKKFLEDKKTYGAAQNAIDPIYNRISSELGNNGVSLTDWILATPDLAMGSPVKALALLGGKRALQQYGGQTMAVLKNAASKAAPQVGGLMPLIQAGNRFRPTGQSSNEDTVSPTVELIKKLLSRGR